MGFVHVPPEAGRIMMVNRVILLSAKALSWVWESVGSKTGIGHLFDGV
jgi:hypothetical protein